MTDENATSTTLDESKADRFAFGANWQAFLETLDDDRIEQAILSLKEMLGVESLEGKSFLDIGSGSGLFSLAAYRLGARVVSIDYDRQSVACTAELRRRESAIDSRWQVEQGSVLDREALDAYGTFDVVYSWGVLHHTGDMDQGIENAYQRVASGGTFFIAIYNDQGAASKRWLAIKRTYNKLPAFIRPLWVIVVAGVYELKFALSRLLRGKNPLPFADWRAKRKDRGMSAWHDWVDWIGGLPFEVATPEVITARLDQAGFDRVKLITVGKGWGCNQFVFTRR